MRSVYYKNLGSDAKYYDLAYECFLKRGKSFKVGFSNVPISDLLDKVLDDHPEIFYASGKGRISQTFFTREYHLDFDYSPSETEKISRYLEDVADDIISKVINDHQSEYDKFLALHDYLKTNVEYDYESYHIIKSYRGLSMRKKSVIEAANIIGPLLNKKCVCEGFAKAYKYLCDKIGLECWVVVGTSIVHRESHAWNIVCINGYYHHVDVTWDVQDVDSSDFPNYGYFCLSDDEISKDHKWERRYYPAAPSSPYNYFKVNNSIIDSKAQLESFFYNSLQNEEEYILFKVVRGSLLEREISGCRYEVFKKALARCKYVKVKDTSTTFIESQLVYLTKVEYDY